MRNPRFLHQSFPVPVPIASSPKSRLSGMIVCTVLFAGALLGGSVAHAGNLLANPSFEASSGNVVASGWTYYRPANGGDGSYWCDTAWNNAHSGNLYWKQWGIYWDAARTNVAGIYQQFNSAPASVYQASGWFFTKNDAQQNDQMGPNNKAWLEVSFRNASGAVLALYKSDDFTTATGVSAWFNLPVTNVCDLSKPTSSGDTNSAYFYYAVTGSVSQLVAPAGTAFVRYQFAMVQGGGWPEGGGSVYFDDAVLNQISGPVPPTITSLSPPNPSIFVNPNDGIKFTASSSSGTTINNSGIHMVVNGVDVSASLAISGSSSNRTVSYSGLLSNATYTASVTVTDAFNFSASATTYFETTWLGIQPAVYLWEAEDFDYTNGTYLNNPALCSASGNPNCYYGKVGVQGVDENNTTLDGDHLYRPDDAVATTGSGDYLRKNLVDAGRLDYKVGWFEGGEWVNYTRDWPSGTYWVIARLANGGGSGTLTFSKVNPDKTTTDVGTFTIGNGRGWTAYDYVYLQDTNGNIANVTFGGKATYRATTGGNVDMGFFMLVAAQVDLPVLSNVYPTGRRPFESTNAFSFTVTSAGSTFPPGSIKLNLDGADVSAQLNISGTDSNKSVVYPGLLANATHTAVVTVTNANGHGINITHGFDTFSQDNYMVDAEDFDYEGGKFIDTGAPGAYGGLGGMTNIDFSHVPQSGEQYQYRQPGLPTQQASDFLRQKWDDNLKLDWNVGYFGYPDWANYTHNYPTGHFRVYGRFAGSGGYTMYLDQVVSGVGTTNQVTQRLGRWGAVGRDWQAYDWVPLTDLALGAPVILKLGGVSTLRISTTGNCNPNYFMLVPASGITLTAARSGKSIVVSFPTQVGVVYRVLYRDDLTTGNWSLLTTVLGDGTVKSTSDASAGAKRFYQVLAP